MFKLMTLALIPALIPALVTAAPTTDTKYVGEFIFPSSSDELERGNSYKVKWNVTDDTVLETYDYAQLFFAPESQDEFYVGDLPFRYDQQADEDGFYATSFHVKDEYPLGGGRLKLKNSGQFGDGNRLIESEWFTIVARKE